MSPDLINGLYELLGGYFILLHVRQLYRDKKVNGVSVAAVVYFSTWGYWNIYYYPHLGQWYSFAGGLFVAAANTAWVYTLIYYGRKSK